MRGGDSEDQVQLHRDWRGQYAFSTDTTGQHTTCVLENPTTCSKDQVNWPAGTLRAHLEGSMAGDIGVWYGSLAAAQSDASGLLYRRNRYYDPQSAQFTQEDPIGIAGGLNLYGYAGGDPINFSDPFGLDECEEYLGDEGEATKEWAKCKLRQYAEEAKQEAEEATEEAEFYERAECVASVLALPGAVVSDVGVFYGGYGLLKGSLRALTGPVWRAGLEWRVAGEATGKETVSRGVALGTTIAGERIAGSSSGGLGSATRRFFSLESKAAAGQTVQACSR